MNVELKIKKPDFKRKGWIRTSLVEIGQWCSGGTPSRKIKDYYGGSIPWIKSGDLKDGLINKTEESITQKGLEKSSAKILPPGTLSIAMYGATIGKLGIFNFPAASNQACANVIPDERIINTKYLFYYLFSEREELIKKAIGGA